MPRSRVDRCASCLRPFATVPVFAHDRLYCCTACAAGHLCTCLAELDRADDGVDGLGLPFAIEPVTAVAEPGASSGRAQAPR